MNKVVNFIEFSTCDRHSLSRAWRLLIGCKFGWQVLGAIHDKPQFVQEADAEIWKHTVFSTPGM